MGKSRAEIQRAYRERKKASEGEKYFEKERKRTRSYYVPTVKRSKKDLATRREKVRKNVQKYRQRMKELETQEQINQSACMQEDDKLIVDDENGVSWSTPNPKIVVKLPFFDPRQRTRRRISRVVSKQNREIEKLKFQNESLQKRYKTVSKRYQRLKKKTDDQPTPSSCNSSVNENEMMPISPRQSTPRKRVAEELREAGVTPRKVPRKVRKMLLLGSALAEEVSGARKDNGKKGRKVIANILSGKIIKKYKLKSLLNKNTGINRKTNFNGSKKCDKVPRQVKQPIVREQIANRVVEFLKRDDNSRLLPGKNDKVKIEKEYLQKRVLNDNLTFLHMKYMSETEEKISFSTFCRMRPKSISLTRYITRNQCLCQRHQNMALTLKAVRTSCANVPLNPDEFIRKVDENTDFLKHTCQEFPDTIQHNQWKKVTLDDGKKRTKIVMSEVDKETFQKTLHEQVAEFRHHILLVKQQYKAIGDLKKNLPDGHVLAHMDFAENFSCTAADEVQSAYWNQNSITLHPVVVYFRDNGELKHINYVFVTDDIGHNIGSVYTFIKKLILDLKQTLKCNLRKVYYWTDGPSSQYKNKTAFFITSNHDELLGPKADWNYFESGHGKGACDGIGGTAKRMADQSIRQGKVSIQDATDFYKWAKEGHKTAKYILVKPDECNKSREELEVINKILCPVKGTMKIHHVKGVSKGVVHTQTTSCYCVDCINGSLHVEYEENLLLREKRKPEKESEHEKCEEENIDSRDKPSLKINLELDSGRWVAVIYDHEWHIGQIKEVDNADDDCLVSFMQRLKCRGVKLPTFKWPNNADEIWVKFEDVLLCIEEPSKVGRSGRSFTIQEEEISMIELKISSLKN
ncbi:uncharacterized protein LOC132724071 [Ruditapes philippinarum]|uniref:uncharacterized protein LOC132724071 n=1 Tax=Ruditapes philippinarum TaxID=129788 RepID=UPI00295A6CD3|nr:uncharacterized protein LOC132724071 [Ruditapes philippinarum]